MANKYIIGLLTVVIMASAIYITLPKEVKIGVGISSTTFYLWNDTSGKWYSGAVEYSNLFNGTKQINLSKSLSYNNNTANFTNITKTSSYGSTTLIDNYQFDGNIADKELFPIRETHEVINGNGLIYQYQVSNLPNGFNADLSGKNSVILGNMKVSWDSGYYYAKITNSSKGLGMLTLKYKVNSNDQTFNIRLFDPTTSVWIYKGNSFANINVSLINSTDGYNVLANPEKISDKRIYTPYPFITADIPIIWKYDGSLLTSQITIPASQLSSFLNETNRNYYGDISRLQSVSYWILQNHTYNYTQQIQNGTINLTQTYPNQYNASNSTVLPANCWNTSQTDYSCNTTQPTYATQTINDWKYDWYDISTLPSITLLKGQWYAVDIRGQIKAGTAPFGVDIVPSFGISGYNFNIPDWAWWNTSWANCRNEILGNTTTLNGDVKKYNFTNLIFSNATNEVRIIDSGACSGGNEIPSQVISSTSSSAYVVFETNTSNISIYYNNPSAAYPNYQTDLSVLADRNVSNNFYVIGGFANGGYKYMKDVPDNYEYIQATMSTGMVIGLYGVIDPWTATSSYRNITKGPVMYSFSAENANGQITYEFYYNKPYFFVTNFTNKTAMTTNQMIMTGTDNGRLSNIYANKSTSDQAGVQVSGDIYLWANIGTSNRDVWHKTNGNGNLTHVTINDGTNNNYIPFYAYNMSEVGNVFSFYTSGSSNLHEIGYSNTQAKLIQTPAVSLLYVGLIKSSSQNWTSAWNETKMLGNPPTITVGSEQTFPPQWSANTTSPNSPQTYNTANNYSFQINWTSSPNNMANTSFQLGSPNGGLSNYTDNTTGLVGYWRLNSVNSSNYTKDFSGYGNDGYLGNGNNTRMPLVTGTNYILNGDFESINSTGYLNNWVNEWTNASMDCTTSKTGSCSLRINHTSTIVNWVAVIQKVSISVSQPTLFTSNVWMKQENAKGSHWKIDAYNATSGQTQGIGQCPAGTDGTLNWTLWSCDYIIYPEFSWIQIANMGGFNYTSTANNSFGYTWFDNESLTLKGDTGGKIGNALQFDGINDYVSIKDNTIRGSGVNLTVEAWFRTSSVNGTILGYSDASYPGVPSSWVPILYVRTDGKLGGEFWQGAVSPIITSSAVNDGNWHHVALSGNGTIQQLYLDGVFVNSLSGTINHLSMSANQIGTGYAALSWGLAGWAFFNGTIDEVRIYNRSLSANEISNLYNMQYPYYAGTDDSLNGTWAINFTQAAIGGAGVYNYTWFGTNSAGNQNSTQTIGYTINKPDSNCTFGTGIYKISYQPTIYSNNPPTNSNWLYVNATNQTVTTPLFACTNNGTASGTFRIKMNATLINSTDTCGTAQDFSNPLNLTTAYQNIGGSVSAGGTLNLWCKRGYNSSVLLGDRKFSYNITIQ